MWEDPIVAEVHRAREQLAAESNYDLATFLAGIRKRQACQKDRPVRQVTPTSETDRGNDPCSPAAPSESVPTA